MPNRLAGETSPYLLQHADNPVDWYPWGEEALARARREGQADPAVDRLFGVPLVPRDGARVVRGPGGRGGDERRCSSTSRSTARSGPTSTRSTRPRTRCSRGARGGWPLTMFLTPDGAPFFGGTYFPKEGRYGLPGFLDLLPRVAAAYREQGAGDRRAERAAAATRSRASSPARRGAGALPAHAPAAALAELEAQRSIPTHGGFGAAPKFPHRDRPRVLPARSARAAATPTRSTIVARHARAHGRRRHPRPAGRRLLPLQRRRASGRSRTSRRCSTTTGRCSRCTRTSRASPATRASRDVARGIVGWLTREMRAPRRRVLLEPRRRQRRRGGQVLRLDARRGRAPLLAPTSTRSPRRTTASTGRRTSRATRGICASRAPLADVAARLGDLARPTRSTRLAAREGGAVRGARERACGPGLDDKILTSWNALAIAGLARAARALDEPRWADLAFAAADALRAHRVARRPAARDAQGRARASQRLSRRPRVPARGAARAHADALPRRGLRLGARARRRAARAVRGPRATAASSSRATTTSGSSTGRSPATTTRRRRATASRRSALIALGHLAARAALRRGGASARCGCSRRRSRESPAGYSTLLDGARGRAGRRRRRCCSPAIRATCAAWQRALERDAAPGGARVQRRGRGDCRPALAKGPAPAAGARRVGLPRARSACRRSRSRAPRSSARSTAAAHRGRTASRREPARRSGDAGARSGTIRRFDPTLP